MFGKGGGFAGIETRYILLDDSRLYIQPGIKSGFQYIGKVDRKLTKQMFHNYQNLGLEQMDLNEPGNMYYFIEKRQGQQVNKKLVWGDLMEESAIAKYHKLMLQIASRMQEKERDE